MFSRTSVKILVTSMKAIIMTNELQTNLFKVGDKVTMIGIGIGYVRDVNSLGYTIYCVAGGFIGKCGDGYLDYHLRAGWVRV